MIEDSDRASKDPNSSCFLNNLPLTIWTFVNFSAGCQQFETLPALLSRLAANKLAVPTGGGESFGCFTDMSKFGVIGQVGQSFRVMIFTPKIVFDKISPIAGKIIIRSRKIESAG